MMVDVSELFHFVMQRKAGIIFQPNLFLGGVWPPRCQATGFIFEAESRTSDQTPCEVARHLSGQAPPPPALLLPGK
jgi:hypothetical protein